MTSARLHAKPGHARVPAYFAALGPVAVSQLLGVDGAAGDCCRRGWLLGLMLFAFACHGDPQLHVEPVFERYAAKVGMKLDGYSCTLTGGGCDSGPAHCDANVGGHIVDFVCDATECVLYVPQPQTRTETVPVPIVIPVNSR